MDGKKEEPELTDGWSMSGGVKSCLEQARARRVGWMAIEQERWSRVNDSARHKTRWMDGWSVSCDIDRGTGQGGLRMIKTLVNQVQPTRWGSVLAHVGEQLPPDDAQ